MKNFKKLIVVTLIQIVLAGSLCFAEESGSFTPSFTPPQQAPSGPNPSGLVSSDNSLFTGSMVSQYPLEVPPGTAGMQPELSLVYNSSSGNGWCGIGWDLSMGVIQRSTKNGIPKYDETDTFVFNFKGSSQELVLVEKKTYSSIYRAKIESGFMQFKYDKENNYWIVLDKNGNQYHFGISSQSRIDKSSPDITFAWLLYMVTDNAGNAMRISYYHDGNQLYPQHITYTDNLFQNLTACRIIEFSLEDREDVLTTYKSGFLITIAKRLESIVMKVKVSNEWKLVRKYKLSYTQSSDSNRSMLTSVTLVGDDNNFSLPPTNFAYQSVESPDLEYSRRWISVFTHAGFYLHDFNGDGRTDAAKHVLKDSNQLYGLEVWFSTGEGFDYKGVWIDTSINTSSLHFGDFNGDGLIDIGRPTYAGYPGLLIWLSTGTGLEYSGKWECKPYEIRPQGFLLGDFNGDGKTDVAMNDSGDGNGFAGLDVWISNGNGFDYAGQWTNAGVGPHNFIFADFNGDRKTDIAKSVLEDPRKGLEVWLSNGTGLDYQGQWLDTTVYTGIPYFEDFNGDGLIDMGLHKYTDYNLDIYLSTGSGLIYSNSLFLHTRSNIFLADFNGDRLTDIAINSTWSDNGYAGLEVWFNTGDQFIYQGEWNSSGVGPRNFMVADFNGDGKVDVGRYTSEDNGETGGLEMWLNKGPVAGLLSSITNPLGGKTNITYKSSTSQYEWFSHRRYLLFPMQVVDKITTNNSIDDAVIITYGYEGGLFDVSAREFLGFARVSKYDAENNRTDTYFLQDQDEGNATKGMIQKQEIWKYDQTFLYHKRLQYTETIYNVETFIYNDPDPNIDRQYIRYFPSVLRTDSHVTGPGYNKHTAVEYEYNNYGNPVKISNLGEVSDASDNKYSYIEYAFNDENLNGDIFRSSLPTRQYTTPVEGDETQRIQEVKLYYDNANDHAQTPVTGNLTMQRNWLKEEGRFLESKKAYDNFGNVVSVTDAQGNTTTTLYDTTFHTFPTQIKDAKEFTATIVYDPKFGSLLQKTDINQQTIQYTYDIFGRLKKIIGPKDSSQYPAEEYIYPDLTEQAPHKIKVIQRFQHKTAGTLDTYTFIDGLGRTLQNQSPAAESSQWVISGETSINSRGLVEKAYIPYYTTSSQSSLAFGKYSEPQDQDEKPHTTFAYDTLGRVTTTMHADGTQSTASYDGWTYTTIDANGHRKYTISDAYGRIIEVKEYNNNGTEIYSTIYSYDTAGNLVKIINDIGEETSIVYDSLGRKTSMDDPKMGHWEYQYDNNGNLIWQKDAKAQITTLEYDKLNRITKKEYYEDQIAFDKSSPDDEQTITYEYDTNSENNICIGRLVKVNDATGETKFIYDELGQIIETTKIIKGKTYVTKSTYDALGRQKNIIYPDGEVVNYTYDAGGQLKTVASNTATYASNITYNASGQMNQLSYGNGIISNYAYDPENLRLLNLRTYNSTTDIQNFSYEYDNIGNITGITDTASTITRTQTFTYDDINRLTKAMFSHGPEETQNYEYAIEYDSVGNILEKDGQDLTDYSGNWECDFADGARGWRPIQGEWEVNTYGRYYTDETAKDDVPGNTPYARSVTTRKWLNPEFSIDMNTSYPASGDWNVAYILFDYQDENNFYYFLIHSGKGILELSKFQDGKQYFYLGGWKTSMHNPYEHYNEQKREPNKITIRQYYNRIQIYVNDSLEMDYWDENPLIGGKIGVQAKLARCHFDNLNVKVDATSDLGENVAIPVDTFEPWTGSWFVHDKKYRGSVGRNKCVYEDIYTLDDLENEGIQIDYTVQTLTPGRYNWETGWLNFNYEDEDNFYYFVIHKTNKDTREIELSKFQDGERYELFKSSDTPSGLYNPLDAQNISIKLKSNDSNPDAMDILIQAGGTELIDVTDISPIIAGSISLETCNSIAEFDNIKVTSLNDKKNVLFEEKFNTYPDYVFPEPQEEKDILYDANGNMVKIKNKTIRYDYDNRPKSIEINISEKEQITTTCNYDYSGQRVFKKVKEEDKTYYIGNLYEEQIAAEKDTTLTKYIYANGQRIASVEITGSKGNNGKKKDVSETDRTVHYYHTDHLGGSNVITNESGIRVQLVEYLPFGEAKLNDKTGDFDTPYKFTGKELDDSSGLYYYGARYYSPELGRFISPDTILQAPYDPQSLNRYAYCRNNPVLYIDEDGHIFWIPIIVGAVMGGTHGDIFNANAWSNFDWAGAAIGGIAGYAGSSAGSWAFSAAGDGAEGLITSGIVGGWSAGAVGSGLTAARYGGDVMGGMMMGGMSGAIAGGFSGGFAAMGITGALGSSGGSWLGAYLMSGGNPRAAWDAAQSSFSGNILAAALTAYTPLDKDYTVEEFYNETKNMTGVSTPQFHDASDIIFNLIALISGGYSHTTHSSDISQGEYIPDRGWVKVVTYGKYEKFGGIDIGGSYMSDVRNFLTTNCTTRYYSHHGWGHPGMYNTQYNYTTGYYWWRR